MIDIHSHILPGVDDGAKSFNHSLEILRGLASQGITDIIATPHYVNNSSYDSTRAENRQLHNQLCAYAKKAGLDINIYLGNEIYIDPEIATLLRQHIISPLADSKYLLVELPMSGEYHDYEDILVSLNYSGYQVILAHPERYHSVWKDFGILEDLAEQGILFQCNLGSIIGQYDKEPKKTIKKLAKAHLIFAFGTDIHHRRDYSEIAKAQKKLARYYTEAELNDLLVNNPAKILAAAQK